MFSHDLAEPDPLALEILKWGYAEVLARTHTSANSNDPHARPALLNLPAGRDPAAGAAANMNRYYVKNGGIE